MSAGAPELRLFSPAGALRSAVALRRAAARLAGLGFAAWLWSSTGRTRRACASATAGLSMLGEDADAARNAGQAKRIYAPSRETLACTPTAASAIMLWSSIQDTS